MNAKKTTPLSLSFWPTFQAWKQAVAYSRSWFLGELAIDEHQTWFEVSRSNWARRSFRTRSRGRRITPARSVA
jgi:hypothetical protein